MPIDSGSVDFTDPALLTTMLAVAVQRFGSITITSAQLAQAPQIMISGDTNFITLNLSS